LEENPQQSQRRDSRYVVDVTAAVGFYMMLFNPYKCFVCTTFRTKEDSPASPTGQLVISEGFVMGGLFWYRY